MPTTIQLTHPTKEKLRSFGVKGETYEEIIKKLYDIAHKQQLREFLLSDENTITLEEAQAELDKKWPKSR